LVPSRPDSLQLTSYLIFSTPGEISVIGPTETVPGDYNHNAIVDAADYVVWRDNLNSSATLPNDSTAGVTSTDYDVWKSNYGQMAGSGSSLSAVPEPTSALLATVALLCIAATRPRGKRADCAITQISS